MVYLYMDGSMVDLLQSSCNKYASAFCNNDGTNHEPRPTSTHLRKFVLLEYDVLLQREDLILTPTRLGFKLPYCYKSAILLIPFFAFIQNAT